jgi:hypothetical protein
LCRNGQWEQAVAELAKPREMAPWSTWGVTHYWLALAHWNLGHRGEALRALREGHSYYDSLEAPYGWFTKLREEVEAVVK